METEIAINQLQHYVHCPRQWGLIAVDGDWSDNEKTISGNLVHQNVDNPFFHEKRGNKIIARSMPVLSEQFGLVGVLDCVEFTKCKDGVFIPSLQDCFAVCVVEYKNGKPAKDGSIKESDAMQLAAQMLCLGEMLGTECEGAVYYNTIRKRVKLCNAAEMMNQIKDVSAQMRAILERKEIPQKRKTQNCNYCSLKEQCLPNIKTNFCQKTRLMNAWVKEYEEAT